MGTIRPVTDYTEELIEDMKRRKTLMPLLDAVRTPDWRKRLHAARRLFAEAERLGVTFTAYETGLEEYLSPIESKLWQDIRQADLPMIAGVPAGPYWLDFADTDRRIAIEADGQRYHDADRDKRRDADLQSMGWTVFRVTGAECHRVLPCRAELRLLDMGEDEIEQAERRFYLTTSEGVCRAIACLLYRDDHEHPAERWMVETLVMHNLQGWTIPAMQGVR